jgi:hypothetical protein
VSTPPYRLARAFSDHAARHARAQHRGPYYAKIVALNPLQAEVTSQRIVLDEDDMVLSQWVRRYDWEYELAVGDTLVVSRMPNEDWLAHDVVTHNAQNEGADPTDPDPPDLGNFVNLVAQIAVTDVDGNITGYIPVYSS